MKKIRTEKQYNLALKKIEELWESKEGTNEYKLYEKLCELVYEYEKIHYPIP